MRIYRGLEGFHLFANVVGLNAEERAQRLALLRESHMPFMVTEFYANLIATAAQPDRDRLLNIVLPFRGLRHFSGRFDPYGNVKYRRDSMHFLQHKYAPTLLVHMYDFCISNCQFCYKVNEIRHEKQSGFGFSAKIDAALSYIDGHPEINNVLYSGGDPAAMEVCRLIECMARLLVHPSIRTVRFATKVLAYNPGYFLDADLLAFLTRTNQQPGKHITIIAQLNHPAEMSADSRRALAALAHAGVQVRGQPTLAAGINDDEDVLVRLHQEYIDHQIIPYYFTVFMPVRGVEQYGIRLHHAYAMMGHAHARLNGLEKKGVLLASHDFGKFEICGFLPDTWMPREIVLRWHERPFDSFLPRPLVERYPRDHQALLLLKYDLERTYCIDHLFEQNGLPFFDSEGNLRFSSA
ncbi:MAG: lysine 2,3-aminomutase [Verrucomicrobiales bacterium]|nr:lysine 2,3-aminomutase [Verrucomicrobiales bacterium]